MKKIVIIIQARMNSSRLPGKVLLPILGRPMFSFQIERLKQVVLADEIVVATTVNDIDVPIVSFCVAEKLMCVRGAEDNVLSRYAIAALESKAEVIVRITSDCPLIDPDLVDELIGLYLKDDDTDYVSNMIFPTWPYGMAVEVFSADVLFQAAAEATDLAEKEHVTPFIYKRPERYQLRSVTRPENLSYHRWTVDTPEDFELITKIITQIYPENPEFRMRNVLEVLEENPDMMAINQHVKQKSI